MKPDDGMVTAETATVLPVLVLLTLVGIGAVAVAQDRIRCADGAREAALAVARGDGGRAAELASAGAGRPVATTVSVTSETSTVTVRLQVRPVSWLPGLTITEMATVATEPTVTGVPS
jgi:Tfp pilus assembly protein PilX